MKNWYVLIDELTHEQECELVQLMFAVKGKALFWDCEAGGSDALGVWSGRYHYWWVEEELLEECLKISYKQAVELLEGELSDEC